MLPMKQSPHVLARLKRTVRDLWLVVALALLGVSVWGFAHLAEDYVTNDPIVGADQRLAIWLHEHASGAAVDVFTAISFAGSTVVLAIVTLTAVAVSLGRRKFGDALLLACVFVGVEALNGLLKLVFQRDRPEFADPFVQLDTFSFPSGHASGSIAVYGAIALLAARAVQRWRARVLVGGAVLALVSLIGFSRLVLGVHYFSDVLAGFCSGFAWLMMCVIAFRLETSHGALSTAAANVKHRQQDDETRFGSDVRIGVTPAG